MVVVEDMLTDDGGTGVYHAGRVTLRLLGERDGIDVRRKSKSRKIKKVERRKGFMLHHKRCPGSHWSSCAQLDITYCISLEDYKRRTRLPIGDGRQSHCIEYPSRMTTLCPAGCLCASVQWTIDASVDNTSSCSAQCFLSHPADRKSNSRDV